MASDAARNEQLPPEVPRFTHPTLSQPKAPRSTPDAQRRHSLPIHYIPPGLWSANTSSASLVESEEAARGEHILNEATAAHRISALRQLNGATLPRHRYAKSTGARNSTFSQPVIVRTYSGAAKPSSEQRDIVTVKKGKGLSIANSKMDLKLPPVEAFSFKGIMEEIKQGVTEDLERIAEICARSKYSLSNQYEVHMPPHGRGEMILHTIGTGLANGPTLQAISSDDEGSRPMATRSRGGRRNKSMAYGTLETIMSSSRSSDEDKSKKKPAAVIAEEVRGRAAMKTIETNNDMADNTVDHTLAEQRPAKHVRSKSASFASMIIDNAHGFRPDTVNQLSSSASLISEPARPKTSTAAHLDPINIFAEPDPAISPTLRAFMSPKPNLIRNESIASSLRLGHEPRPSILGSLGSWLPWAQPPAPTNTPFQGRLRSASHAEGSLRELLKSTESDRKGKTIDRYH